MVETPEFAAQLQSLGNFQRLDDALAALSWAISQSPEDFPIIPGTERLRLAKTPYVEWAGGRVGALHVWFTIQDEHTVLLLFIEKIEDFDEDLLSDTDVSCA